MSWNPFERFTKRPDKLPLIGSLFDDPDHDRQRQAFEDVRAGYEKAGPELQARRKEQLRQTLAMFEPVDNLMAQMYGPGAAGPPVDIDALFAPLGNQADPAAAEQKPFEIKKRDGGMWSSLGGPSEIGPYTTRRRHFWDALF